MNVETVHPSQDFLHIAFLVAAHFQTVSPHPSKDRVIWSRVSSSSSLGIESDKKNSSSLDFEAINFRVIGSLMN